MIDPKEHDAGPGLSKIRGAWPGDESIEQILDALDDTPPQPMNELFEQGHPGTTPRPARTDATDTRDASYAEIQDSISDAQREYLDILASVCAHGYRTRSGDVIYDLTDKEAALLLGWDRTSVNGRRNELCGGSGSKLRFVTSPAVVRSEKRQCSVTRRLVTPWKISNQLTLEV